MEAARRWRTNRILRFSERQARERSWINFKELAERYGRNVSVSEGFKQLQAAILRRRIRTRWPVSGSLFSSRRHQDKNDARMAGGHHRSLREAASNDRTAISRLLLGAAGDGARLEQFPQCEREVLNTKRPTRRGRPKGFSPIDDSAALKEMRRLRAKFKMSYRAAAREAVVVVGVRGNSQDADIDRLRKKFADECTR